MKILALASCLLLGSALGGQDEQSAEVHEPLLVPGGVTDAAGKVVYLTDLGGGIVAVDGASGAVLWESASVTRPFALVGNRLIALQGGSGRFSIALLDAEDGERVHESEPVVVTELSDVAMGLDSIDEGKSFHARTWLTEGGALVTWSAARTYFGGACPKEEILARINRHASGVVRISLDPWKVELLPEDRELAARSITGAKRVEELPASVQAVARRERWTFGCVVGKRVYGQAPTPGVDALGQARACHAVQAVDGETGELLWERTVEMLPLFKPPPP